jgi:hypothetical protein
MRGRSGAVLGALAPALGVLAGAAATASGAEGSDDPSLIEFTVPNKAAIDKLNGMGFDFRPICVRTATARSRSTRP